MEEILHQLIGSLSHYLQGFIHPRCFSRQISEPSTGPITDFLVFSKRISFHGVLPATYSSEIIHDGERRMGELQRITTRIMGIQGTPTKYPKNKAFIRLY